MLYCKDKTKTTKTERNKYQFDFDERLLQNLLLRCLVRTLSLCDSENAVFLFFYFLFSFFTKIYFCFRNLQEYTPAAPLLGGRDLGAQLRGGRGFSAKILRNFLQKNPWRTGRPIVGRPPPRPPGSERPPPRYRCFTKNSEKNSRFVVILFI